MLTLQVIPQDPICLANLQFPLVNLTALILPETDHTLYAAGSFHGDIHVSLHAPYPSTEALWEFNTALEGSINNSVLHVPSNGNGEPRLVVGSNNNSVRFFDVPIRTRPDALHKCGILEMGYRVNHCKHS